MSHWIVSIVYLLTPHNCMSESKGNCNFSFIMLLPYMCPQQICPSNATYSKYFMYRYETNGTLVSTPFTLLTYAPRQICQPYYMSYCTVTGVYKQTPHYCTYPLKITATFINHGTVIHVLAINMPIKCHMCSLPDLHLWGSLPVYVPNMKLQPSVMWPEMLSTDARQWQWCLRPIT